MTLRNWLCQISWQFLCDVNVRGSLAKYFLANYRKSKQSSQINPEVLQTRNKRADKRKDKEKHFYHIKRQYTKSQCKAKVREKCTAASLHCCNDTWQCGSVGLVISVWPFPGIPSTENDWNLLSENVYIWKYDWQQWNMSFSYINCMLVEN